MEKIIESFPNYTITDQGVIYSKKSNKIMKQHLDKDGYLVLNLSDNGIKKCCKVHRLVALAFIPNPEGLATVNHINHNKQDNSVTNLEWLSNYDNAKDGSKYAPRYSGEKATAAKLTQAQADQIRLDYSNGISRKELAKQYNITTVSIGNIINNKTYCK